MAARPSALHRAHAWRRPAGAIALLLSGLAPAALAQPAVGGAEIPRWQLEASVLTDDNVTRGRRSADIVDDQSLGVRLARDWDHAIGQNSRLMLTASGGGERFNRHRKLSHAFAEVEAVIEYRATGNFTAPTYGVFVRAAADESQSTLRSGSRATIGARVSVALTDRIFAVASVGHDTFHARSAVFSGRRSSLRLNLDYALSDRGTVYTALDLRQGDTTGSGRESLENIDIAKSFVADDAFAQAGLLTYRFEARTVVAVLGYNHGLGSDMSIDVSWRRAETRPRDALPFVSPLSDRYVANQVVLAVLKRF